MELIDPAAVPTTAAARTAYLQDGTHWRSSREFYGTPAAAGTGAIQTVVVNEVLAHTDLPLLDSIELYNATDAAIDIGGWYLSDTNADYQKYRIPDGTVLAAHEYRVFDEDDFGLYFRLDSENGDDVWLLSADAAGKLAAFVDHVEFGAVGNGVSLGRWPDGTGDLYPLKNRTLGEPNDIAGNGPRIGPLLISEVMYRPNVAAGQNPDDYEYVEIFNPTERHRRARQLAAAQGRGLRFRRGHDDRRARSAGGAPLQPRRSAECRETGQFQGEIRRRRRGEAGRRIRGPLGRRRRDAAIAASRRTRARLGSAVLSRLVGRRNPLRRGSALARGQPTAAAVPCSGSRRTPGATPRRVGPPPRPRSARP